MSSRERAGRPPTWDDVEAALARAERAEAELARLRGVVARHACKRLANILASRCRPLGGPGAAGPWEGEE